MLAGAGEKKLTSPSRGTISPLGLQELCLQLAMFTYSGQQCPIKSESPARKLECFVNVMKHAAAQRGDEDFVEFAAHRPDPSIPRELASYIKMNPYYPLPEGYKKVEEKVVVENYSVPCYLSLPESYVAAIELLDSLLNRTFDFHILEPIVSYDYEPRLTPALGRVRNHAKECEKHFMSPLTRQPRRPTATLSPVKSFAGRSVFAGADDLSLFSAAANTIMSRQQKGHTLSPATRLILEKVPKKFKGVVKEVAEVVNDIVEAVEDGRDTLDPEIMPQIQSYLQLGGKGKLSSSNMTANPNSTIAASGTSKDLFRVSRYQVNVLPQRLKKEVLEQGRKLRDMKMRQELDRKFVFIFTTRIDDDWPRRTPRKRQRKSDSWRNASSDSWNSGSAGRSCFVSKPKPNSRSSRPNAAERTQNFASSNGPSRSNSYRYRKRQ